MKPDEVSWRTEERIQGTKSKERRRAESKRGFKANMTVAHRHAANTVREIARQIPPYFSSQVCLHRLRLESHHASE